MFFSRLYTFRLLNQASRGKVLLRTKGLITKTLVPLTMISTSASSQHQHPASTSPAATDVSEVVIRRLNDQISTFSRPFERGGIHAGVRMSAIKTAKGLVLYNPTELDNPTKIALTELGGQVTHIVAPNLVHHLFLEQMALAYPSAMIVAPEGMKEKHHTLSPNRFIELKDTTQHVDFGDSSIQHAYFPDVTHQEIMLFHVPSKTMFCCDLFWNLPATEQYQHAHLPEHIKTGIMQSLGDTYVKPDGTLHKLLSWAMTSRTEAFNKEMIKIFDIWIPSTVVPEHGDVVTTNAVDKLRNAWSWAWPEKKNM